MMRLFYIPVFLVLAVFSFPVHAAVPEPGALCRPEEEVLFSCRLETSNRLVSLCASPGMSRGTGYMQYRAGDFDRLEEEFPNRREEYSNLFNYVRVFPAGSEKISLSFVNNNSVYELYSRSDMPPNPPYMERGLRQAPAGALETIHRCREPVIDRLVKLEDIFR
jgi:hypothetical protein